MADIYYTTIDNMVKGFQQSLDVVNSQIDVLSDSKAELEAQIAEGNEILADIISGNPAALNPTGFTATPEAGIINLSWGNMGAEYSYKLEGSTVSDFSGLIIDVYNGTGNAAHIDTATPDVHYYFRIKSLVAGKPDSGYSLTDAISV